ncbi:MAG: hypothetical protein Q9187_001305 [Circinaria calcarea]
MADPFSIAGSAVGVTSLGLTVCQGLLQYYRAYKDYEDDVLRMCTSVNGLQQTLHVLDSILRENTLIGEAVTKVEENILACEEGIKKLNQKLAKVREANVPSNVSGKVWIQLRRALYPFKESTMAKFREILADLRDGLSFSLSTLEIYTNGEFLKRFDGLQDQVMVTSNITVKVHNDLVTVGKNVTEVGAGVDALQKEVASHHTGDRQQKIFEWLSSPDPSSNHNAAYRIRQQATGLWLIESPKLINWKVTKPSLLWLHGIPGCGKTILCSGVISDIEGYCQSQLGHAFAYFYFDFNDVNKKRHGNFLRSMVTQFSLQSTNSSDVLSRLYRECQDGMKAPDIDKLAQVLHTLLGGFEHAYIVLDALDECQEQKQLLEMVEKMYHLPSKNVSVFVTSRKEPDIEASLRSLDADEICTRNAQVDADIKLHVREQLQNDPKLKSFPEDIKEEVQSVLIDGSHGMFRWAVCQLDELRKCVKIPQLRRTLNSLPKTLDATYDRILCSIEEVHSEDAHLVLQWLAFSARPLTLREIAEVIAVNFTGDLPKLDIENRLLNPHGILQICSSLITLSTKPGGWSDLIYDEDRSEVRLAHYSVKEYLVSDRIRAATARKYSISNMAAHELIAETCLAYLLHFDNPEIISDNNLEEYPLLAYSAVHWPVHALILDGKPYDTKVDILTHELLDPNRKSMNSWLCVYNPDRLASGHYRDGKFLLNRSSDQLDRIIRHSPLYFASLLGLSKAAQRLLDNGVDVNAKGGRMACALGAASYNGHESIVRLLLDRGANFYFRDGCPEFPLEAASVQTHVNFTLYKGVLEAAVIRGHESIVRLLLDRELGLSYHDSTIQSAFSLGQGRIANLLLSYHAEVNKYREVLESALRAVSYNDPDNIVKLLLHRGAGIGFDVGPCDSALQAACFMRHKNWVQLSLNHHADVAGKSETGQTALHFAALIGDEEIVDTLLKKGADIHAEDEHGWTPGLLAFTEGRTVADSSLLGDIHSALALKGRLGLLPSRWVSPIYNRGTIICDNGKTAVREDGRSIDLDLEPLQLFANHPLPATQHISYFEVSILDEGSESIVCIGLAHRLSHWESLPGWDIGSWGHHGDDGQKFGESGQGTLYGPTFGTGDVVGCGVDFHTRTIFFTKNGKNLGKSRISPDALTAL